MEFHHSKEVVLFVRDGTEQRELTPVLIKPVNLTTPQKKKTATKDNLEMWEYYE